jgi:hypothetical protein
MCSTLVISQQQGRQCRKCGISCKLLAVLENIPRVRELFVHMRVECISNAPLASCTIGSCLSIRDSTHCKQYWSSTQQLQNLQAASCILAWAISLPAEPLPHYAAPSQQLALAAQAGL